MTTSKYLWFDLETNDANLHPSDNVIYEVAAVVADENFEPIDDFSMVVGGTLGHTCDLDDMSPFIKDMHVKSGLYEEIPFGERLDIVEDHLIDFMRENFSKEQIEKKQIIMAGHSIAFDRRMTKEHMQKFDAMLSHRLRDIGDIGRMMRDPVEEGGLGLALPNGDTKAHRALQDALGALAEFKQAREILLSMKARL